jgi:hypothetical protein
MALEQARRRWFIGGCALASTASIALMAFPLLPEGAIARESLVFAVVCGLTALMATGALLAVFSVSR